VIARFLDRRALRAAARKRAARRSVWQAGGKWVRFVRFYVARVRSSYPLPRTTIAIDCARVSAPTRPCEHASIELRQCNLFPLSEALRF
jgi:hypothetical protein